MELKAIRLLPDKPDGWLWWPAFEARVKNFCEKYTPRTDTVPLSWDLRQKFINTPNFTGYWLVLDSADKPVGHMASWLVSQYNKNHIFVYQAEADDGIKITSAVRMVLDGLDHWAKDLNRSIREPVARIDRVEMCTFRDAEVWMRYLKMLDRTSAELRSVIGFALNVADEPANMV